MEDLILYHATDARVVKFSKEDRAKITNFCKGAELEKYVKEFAGNWLK
jgi:DNA primase catalytic subunit